jgi:hypothetical protein
MRAGLAFWAGVIGAAVIVLGMWISRALGGTDFNLGLWWGSMITGTTTGWTWLLGFVIHLIIGGLVALAFAAAFESLRRSNWWLGLIGGAIFAAIAGLVVGGLSKVHPAIPQAIPDPGYYTANFGVGSVITFWAVYLVYGIIVGVMYVPARIRRVVETRREERLEPLSEEHAVEAGAPRHDEHVVGAGVRRTEERVEETESSPEDRYVVSGGKTKPPKR